MKKKLYEKASTKKVTSNFNYLWQFTNFLEHSNSKGKIEFFEVLDFAVKNSKGEKLNSCTP
jgi:hypothetical protein